MKLIDKLTSWPRAFGHWAGALNQCIKVCNLVLRMKAGPGIKVDFSDANILISAVQDDGEDVDPDPVAGVRFFRAEMTIDPEYPDFPAPADIRAALDDLYDPDAAEPITPQVGDSVVMFVDTNPSGTAALRPRLIYTIVAGPGFLGDWPESSTRIIRFNPDGGATSSGYAAIMTQTGIW
jgi:hypothetical protein